MNYIIIVFLSYFLLLSCKEQNGPIKILNPDLVYLPDTLTQISSTDLHPILSMVGGSKIIGLGESNHFMNEPLDFRNELIKFLVKEKRVDIIAIESGIVESKHLFDYVNGQVGDIDSVIYNGLSWTFDRINQNKELIQWLRLYNKDTTNLHKVKLYGYDIPGSPLNPRSNHKLDISIKEALKYIRTVNYQKWVEFNNKISPFLDYIHINISNSNIKQYTYMDVVSRNKLTGAINDLIKLYQLNEIRFVEQTSTEEYNWAYLSAISSREVDDWLRTIPTELQLSPEITEIVFSNFFWDLHHKRDQTMAQNIEWIKSREEDANILIFGHINHITKSPQKIVIKDAIEIFKHENLGQYLKFRYKDDYKTICNYQFEISRRCEKTHVASNAFENSLLKKSTRNYYMLVKEKDKESMDKEWKIGESFLNAKNFMNPYQGTDIILFTPTQTEMFIE